MRATVPIDPSSREVALRNLHDPTSWTAWVPGLRAVRGEAPRLELEFGGPRPFRVVVQVGFPADGVTLQLEEGEVQNLSGSVTLEPAALHVDVELEVGPTVPGILLTSLESDYVTQLAEALAPAPRGSDRSDD
ncbi:MAG: hypothetical protein R3F61_37190 [Myxococcota bacterium]